MNKLFLLLFAVIAFPLFAQYNAMCFNGKGALCLLSRESIEVKGTEISLTVSEDLFRPFGLDTLPDGTFLVADSGNSTIKILNESGQILSTFGGKGSSDSSLLRPLGVCSDGPGRIIVSDTGNNCIKVFDKAGAFLFKFGTRGYGDNEFLNPFHVFRGRDDSIFVVDPGNICVKKFSASGKFLIKFSERLLSASDAAVDPDGNVYICDYLDRSVKLFSAEGKFKGFYRDRFYYTKPTTIAISRQGYVAVEDSGTGLIEVLSPENKVTQKIETRSNYRGGKIYAACADRNGVVFSTSFQDDYVYRLGQDGKGTSFGGNGTAPGLLREPRGIGADSKGRVFVSDSFNGRIEQFDNNGKFLAEFNGYDWPLQLAVGIDDCVYVSETGKSVIRKTSAAGKTLMEIKPGDYFNPGPIAVDAAGTIGVINTLNKSFVLLDPAGKAFMSLSFENKWPVSVAAGEAGTFYVFDALESIVYMINKTGLASQIKLELSGRRREKYGVLIYKEGKLFFLNSNKLSEVIFPTPLLKQQ